MSTIEGSLSIDNSADVLDSRDIIARIAYLEAEYEDLKQAVDNADSEDRYARIGDVEGWAIENGHELSSLRALAEYAEGYSEDWQYGTTLIRDDYFEKYAEQLADDLGYIDRNANWPINCIDWEEAASQLQQDYFSVDFDGVTYWLR